MKLTVLVDNNTIIDRYFIGEPGISLFIEEEGKKILFDTGYTDAFIKNGQKLGVDFLNLDYVGISHGHIDHTWGLMPLTTLYTEAIIENKELKKPELIAHPLAFLHKYFNEEVIGSMLQEEMLGRFFSMKLSKEPVWITEKLVYLGEIERTNEFENKEPIGKYLLEGAELEDFILDDTALAYKSKDGLVIITGCSHSGICNIIEYAKKVCTENRVYDIIGGLHLLNPDKNQLEHTKNYLKKSSLKTLHACHCTDLGSKIALSEVTSMKEVGVGLVLEYE